MITIDIWEDSEGLLIRIKDNGCGFDVSSVASAPAPEEAGSYMLGNRIALPNIEKRLELMYGMSNLLHTASIPGEGTTVTISLPYSQNGNSPA